MIRSRTAEETSSQSANALRWHESSTPGSKQSGHHSPMAGGRLQEGGSSQGFRGSTETHLTGPELIRMQDALGNYAVQQLINPKQALTVQPKLMLGDAKTVSEREADRTAQQLLAGRRVTSRPGPARGAQTPVPPSVERDINQARGGGQKLPEQTRASFEENLGIDLGSVRIHADARSDRLNQSLQAKAFTTGNNIFFRRGTYNPSSSAGASLLAHELTHVAQQSPSVQRATANNRLIQRWEYELKTDAGQYSDPEITSFIDAPNATYNSKTRTIKIVEDKWPHMTKAAQDDFIKRDEAMAAYLERKSLYTQHKSPSNFSFADDPKFSCTTVANLDSGMKQERLEGVAGKGELYLLAGRVISAKVYGKSYILDAVKSEAKRLRPNGGMIEVKENSVAHIGMHAGTEFGWSHKHLALVGGSDWSEYERNRLRSRFERECVPSSEGTKKMNGKKTKKRKEKKKEHAKSAPQTG